MRTSVVGPDVVCLRAARALLRARGVSYALLRLEEVVMRMPVIRWLAVVVAVGRVVGCAARAQRAESSAAGVKASGVAVAASAAADAVPPHVMLVPAAMKWQPFAAGAPGVTVTVL